MGRNDYRPGRISTLQSDALVFEDGGLEASMKLLRTRAVWLAIGLVLGGGTLSYAAVGASTNPGHSKKPTPTVSATENEHETDSDDQSDKKDKGKSEEQSSNRKHNHGYWVSLAAQCKDVNTDHVTIQAPKDCDSNGSAHGDYVSQVAQSDVGKKSHPNHGNPTG